MGAGAAALGLAMTGCAASAPARSRGVQLTLPPPTGPYRIGTVALHLVDRARRDPWLTVARRRELMISIWYPATGDARYPWAPWIPRAAGKLFLRHIIPAPPGTPPTSAPPTQPPSLPGVRLPVARARLGAPADLSARRYPVVLYSPGYQEDREIGTALVSDLASRGYIVVTTDYTYEAAEVEFPGGRVEVSRQPAASSAILKAATVRNADTTFVLAALAALNSGVNPDAGHQPLPSGLAGALDLDRVGMFGHSLGGSTTAQAMAAGPEVRAGIDLDGSIVASVALTPGSKKRLKAELARAKHRAGAVAKRLGGRPFMIMSSAGRGPDDDPTWAGFWPSLPGWRLFLTLEDSEHYTYTDEEEFLSQLVTAGIIPASLGVREVIPVIGTIDAASAVAAERAYIGAFFDMHLRNTGGTLLHRPSPQYPDVRFVAT
jgi:Platelet-activating factor acetylhydrolase, isoform II